MVQDLDIRLKLLRYQHKKTQKEISARVHIDNSTLSSYENGTATPSAENVAKLAVAYKTTSDYLLGLDNRRVITLDPKLTDEQYSELIQIINSSLNLIGLSGPAKDTR